MPHDVHGAGVAAACHDHQTLVADVYNECLVVQYQRIRLPRRPGPSLMHRRHAVLEVGRPIDLTGDQDRTVQQQRWLAALDDLESLVSQRPFAQSWPFVALAAWRSEASAR